MAHDKYVGKSKIYKGVYLYRRNGRQDTYSGEIQKKKKLGFETEREAAIWVDMRLIEAGKEPVNILKRKKLQS